MSTEKRKGLEDILRQIQEAARDGRVELAAPPQDAYFEEAFVKEFFRKVLDKDWAKIVFVSEETSCKDFLTDDYRGLLVVTRVHEHYGVDITDLAPALNLWKVLRRIEEQRA